MAETICNWLLVETNGSRDYAIAKYEDVKTNIMTFLGLQDAKLFALRFEFLARSNLSQAFRLANKAGNACKLPLIKKNFNMMFYPSDTDFYDADFVEDILVDKGIFPKDQFPQGFNEAKSFAVTSMVFVQVILFMAAILDGPEQSSLLAPDPRLRFLQIELNKERQEANMERQEAYKE